MAEELREAEIMNLKCKNMLEYALAVVVAFYLLYCGYTFFLIKAYPVRYYAYVSENSEKFNVEKELILAIIKSESNFRQDAESKAGAIGLMQIMPDTFEWLQAHKLVTLMDVGHLKDPKTNIKYGVYLLSILQKRYNTIIEVVCAYNAGIGTVDRWLRDEQYSDDGKTLKKIPFPDTSVYLENVIESCRVYKNLYFN